MMMGISTFFVAGILCCHPESGTNSYLLCIWLWPFVLPLSYLCNFSFTTREEQYLLLHCQVLLHFWIQKPGFLTWSDGHNPSQRELFLLRRRCLAWLFVSGQFCAKWEIFHRLSIKVAHHYSHLNFSSFSLDTVLLHSVSVCLVQEHTVCGTEIAIPVVGLVCMG